MSLREPGAILLISCYELGHQPLGAAWPRAFLERAGYAPATLDLSIEPLDEAKVARARVIGIAVPMHTALRIGARAVERIRDLNPGCVVVFYGLYALLNRDYLLGRFADVVLGGEFEGALVALCERVEAGQAAALDAAPSLDRLNGPGHALKLVRALHAEFPAVTYDFTAKIEHIVRHRGMFPEFAATGCLFVVSAVESLSNVVLANLEKGHTQADVSVALDILRRVGITLRPSFVPFTPWETFADYLDLLDFIAREDLIDQVDPVQLTIRLLVPPGSLLLSRPAIQPYLGELDAARFTYRWTHPDPRMDALQREVSALVEGAARSAEDPAVTFQRVQSVAYGRAGRARPLGAFRAPPPERPVPARLTEPWFC